MRTDSPSWAIALPLVTRHGQGDHLHRTPGMTRISLTYGLISGLVVIGGHIGGIVSHASSTWLGYLIMLVALSSILVGVKQHRDQALGGVISFRTALLIGLG